MDNFKRLEKQINSYKEAYGTVPKVQVNREFWEKNSRRISKLTREGVRIEVADNLQLNNSYLLQYPREQYPAVDTLHDLKKEVDRLVAEGKGDWPVKVKSEDDYTYQKITLCPSVPGHPPVKRAELISDFTNAPDGEHILIMVNR